LKSKGKTDAPFLPAYGDLSLLNTDKTIINAVGRELLSDIVGDYNNLLETSAAVYEKNGDYALGIFSSSWCRFMDNASRNLCETDSNKEALNSGKWHCHESCWKNASLESIKQKKAIDIECAGGIRLYAIPIIADNNTIGSINFGYGNPPNDEKKLKELAGKFKVSYSELSKLSQSYTPRSDAIIEVAKERLRSSARLIGEMVSRQKAQEELKLSEDRYKRLVENSPQISYIFSNKRGAIFWSSGIKKVLGYEPDQIIQTPFLWMESIFPEDKRMVENFLQQDIIKEGDIYKYRVYDKDKNLHWLKDIIIKVTRKENETIYEGIVIDETDSVKRNKDLHLALLSIESSSTSVIWTNLSGKLIYANEIAYKSLGYSKEEFFKLKIQDYDIEWSKNSLENNFNFELKENGIHKTESWYKRKDGSVFPVKITTHLIRYENENYLYAYIEDMSEQKEREKKISDSEAEMRFLANSAIELLEKKAIKDIFDYLADKIFHLLEGKAIITVSEFETNYDRYTVKKISGVHKSLLKATRILGFDIEGMRGRINTSTTEKLTEGKLCPLPDNLSEISNGIIPEKANQALKKLLNLKDIHSISIKYKDGLFGNVTIIRSSNCKDLNFKLIEAFIFQVSLFISKLIATKDLEESQARMKNLIANLQGVVYRCRNDEKWTMSYLNDEIQNLSGFSKEEIIENKLISYNELIHPEDRERVRVEILDSLKAGSHFSIEYRIKVKSGATKWVFEKGLGIKDINGKYSQLEGFITDITRIKENQQRISDQLKKIQEINLDLKKAKEQAEESDKLKSAFLANMSHEIRTPMNSILGFSEMLGTKELNPEKKERFILNITHSGEQLLRIIDDIIDISKIESNQLSLSLKNCDIDESINEVLENLENSKIRKLKPDLYLKFIPNKKLKSIIFESDSIRFRQILFNLISNAIKFTEYGGVEIGYKIVYYELNSFLQFYVKDTGIGISEENRKRIFERFIQADGSKIKEGTGLGLSITKAIVELLGGRIWVESTLCEGSVFYFELPFKLQKEDDELEKKPKTMKKKDFEGAKIYIAEDDISSYLLLEEYLENTGAVLHHAQNGLKLLEMIKAEIPDLILLDINMPVLNGYQAIEKIRQSHPDLPVIAQTAYAMQNEKRAILEAGCNDYISKPIKKADLIDQISKLL
jgi:PAS domain S-box-containing protein